MCVSPICIDREQGTFVPCGKCYQCRSARARDWQFRMQIELEHSTHAYFITLTYNDRNVPSDYSLKKDDFQRFMKRARKFYKKQIRYFACGEYGDQFGRPHYHAIMFFRDYDFDIIAMDNILQHAWTLGHYIIGTVTSDSIAYVTKYMVKQWQKDWREKPFQLMSRRPLIGFDFITEEAEVYYNTPGVLPICKDLYNRDRHLPRAFRKKLIFADKQEELKEYYEDYQKKKQDLILCNSAADLFYWHWLHALKEDDTKKRKK